MKKYILNVFLLILISMFFSTAYAENIVQEENESNIISVSEENKIEVQYEYNRDTNEVIAKIVSNVELKNTKPTWTLSNDKLIYSKIFSNNQIYTTPVEDINGNVAEVKIEITQVKNLSAEVQYEYNSETNEVTAKIISNVKLANTKPTWNLSDDKFTYTKIFDVNQTYETQIQDIRGNLLNVKIIITQVKKLSAEVQYEYNSETNEVTAKIISNVKLANTKPTWSLSSDKFTYNKIFKENQAYETQIQDLKGNIINVTVKITEIDNQAPKIIIEYIHNDDNTVTVYMKSNEKLGQTKPTWELVEDKFTYKKTFDKGQNYLTSVSDIYGNSSNVKINFEMKNLSYLQNDDSKINVKYLYIGKEKAIVEIVSSVQMKDTKPTWFLSEDGYRYTKTFTSNNIYVTPIEDINGVTKNVNIIINIFQNYLVGIDVSAHQGEIDWEEVKKSGIDFAILRCGYGQNIPSQDDKYFARNIAECEKLGIQYGIYIYSYALTEDDAYSEAKHMLRLINGYNPTYGVWIDMEDADGYKQKYGMPSDTTLVNICAIFCDELNKSGYDAGIYANYYWFITHLDSSKLDKYNKWVAQWGNSCDYDKKYVMWQYTDKGTVNGISGDVDMNIYFK